MTARLTTLPEVEAALWAELDRAVHERGHPWRLLVLASVETDGSGTPVADARTVVLREVDVATRALVVYTDSRSAKARQLRAQPVVTLVAWSQPLGWQLRLRARAEVHDDGLAIASRWARLRMTPAAHDYLSPLAPGEPLAGPTTSAPGELRESFSMLTATVDSIDWLELHADGHRRARFDSVGARWIQP